MIVIAPEKVICKSKVADKIARRVPNIKFFDATERGNRSKAHKFNNVSTMDIFNPLRSSLCDDTILDGSSIEARKKIEKHFDDKHVNRDIKVIGKYQIEHDETAVILILKNKVYKLWAKRYIKEFKNVLKISGGVYSLDEVLDKMKLMSKGFSEVLSKKEYKKVQKICGLKSKKTRINKLKLPF